MMRSRQQAVTASKKIDQGRTIHQSKLRGTAGCGTCGAIRVIYHDHAVVLKNGPSQQQLDNLEESLEDTGYYCGKPIDNDAGFFMQESIRCGDYMESQYYNPKAGLKGGRLLTKDICAICYEAEDVVSINVIGASCNIGGKNTLPVC